MKQLLRQMVRFGVVGIVSFFIDYFLMIFLIEVVHMDIVWSTTISYTISVIFNYKVSTMFVFSIDASKGKHRIFIRFVILSFIGLIFNELLIVAFVDYFMIYYLIAKILATMIVTVFNFITRKLFIEARNRAAFA